QAPTAIGNAVASRTRDEWCRIMEGTDACFAPVLTVEEAARHPHNVARGSFVSVNGVEQNAPAPRLSPTPPQTPHAPPPATQTQPSPASKSKTCAPPAPSPSRPLTGFGPG